MESRGDIFENYQSRPIATFHDLLALSVMFFQVHSEMSVSQIPSNLPDK